MKNALVSTITALGIASCYSQGFVNLDFEQSSIVSSQPSGNGYNYGTAAIPGWTVNTVNYFNNDPNTIPFNAIALDGPAVNLEGTNFPYAAIQGNYSIYLQGGTFFSQNTNGASIWQTAQIPSTTQSVTYWGGSLQVTFNGQMLSFVAISNTLNYTVWGADISAFAGQTGQLVFSVPWEISAMLDNIQFSSLPIPEPSALSLSALGGLLLAWCHRRFFRAHDTVSPTGFYRMLLGDKLFQNAYRSRFKR